MAKDKGDKPDKAKDDRPADFDPENVSPEANRALLDALEEDERRWGFDKDK